MANCANRFGGIAVSLVFVCINSLWENSSGRGSNMVLCTIAFQEPSDSAHGELPSGIKTSLFSLKTSCGKLSENSRLDIATIMFTSTNNVTNILLDKNTILKLQNR